MADQSLSNGGGLPGDLITRARDLLLPHARTVDERDALITEAFYVSERRIYDGIALEGTPNTFCVKCVRALLDLGCLDDRQHALARLLAVVRSLSGLDGQRCIDELTAPLNRSCSRALGSPRAEAQPARVLPPPANPTQTLATPPAQRTPTVHLIYARPDAPVAHHVIRELQAAGHACWIDVSEFKGSDEWVRAISEGINNSYAVLVFSSPVALEDRWVREEVIWAKEKRKRIVQVLLADFRGEPFLGLPTREGVPWYRDHAAGVSELLRGLPSPQLALPDGLVEARAPRRAVSRRALELEYLERLRFEELLNTEKYTPLAGTSYLTVREAGGQGLQPVVMRPEFEHTPWTRERPVETRRFENAVEELLKIRRAVVLGEPGAGKTTTLWTLGRKLLDDALSDPKALIPFLIRLGKWTRPDQPLLDFIAQELGELGSHAGELLKEKRAAPLLDGLNEVPVAGREAKARQVQALIEANPDLIALVTSREQDYTPDVDLGFDRVAITPLDPLRVREFVHRYLGESRGEALFQKVLGSRFNSEEEWFERRFAHKLPDWQRAFWLYTQLPKTDDEHDQYRWERWLEIRDDPASLLQLARNPYLLFMLCEVYQQLDDLPGNRGKLFDEFVETLLVRERIAQRDPRTRKASLSPEAGALLSGLERLAFEMQTRRTAPYSRYKGDTTAGTSLPIAGARGILNDRLLYLASSASIVSAGEEVRFTHQLLQEYFTARSMREAIEGGALRASNIWKPVTWWERTGWEEATVLLAGLYSDDCTPVLDWIAEANPEVAAHCAVNSDAQALDATLLRLREKWLPRLSDLKNDPDPRARAAVGRALGMPRLSDGSLLDNRRGGALTPNPSPGGKGEMIPDIDWVEIPAGEFKYGEKNKIVKLRTFWISRYPITYAQFQAFVDAPDGFHNPQWWKGLAADDEHKRQPGEQAFTYWNHPRESVSWYDAIAFCRWLGDKLGIEVQLPSERQWEKAARGPSTSSGATGSGDGREYPYHGSFDAVKANTYETSIGLTSAVGIFPNGASPYGVMDMSGNVWEWCLNEYGKPERTQPSGSATRVVRGGSWDFPLHYARAVFRNRSSPGSRFFNFGFRLLCGSAPIS